MKISENVKKVLIVSLVTLVVILLIRFVGPPFVAAVVYLFSLLSPFIIGYIFARLINPVADRLKKWIKLPRGISAVLIMILAVGIVGTVVGFLGHRLFEEGKNLYMSREEIALSLQDTWTRFSDRFGQLYINMPDAIKSATDGAVNGIYKQCIELAGNISVVDKAQVIAKALPLALIWTIMFILSIYFMVSRNVRLTETVRRYMGEKSADKLAEIKGQCKRYLGGYVKAQMILMLIVFFVISIILSIFRAPYVLLIAALTAILDALPFSEAELCCGRWLWCTS